MDRTEVLETVCDLPNQLQIMVGTFNSASFLFEIIVKNDTNARKRFRRNLMFQPIRQVVQSQYRREALRAFR
jgi:hypothetical protein